MNRLPEEVYRYRKRKKISIDGTMSGLGYSRSRRGINTSVDIGPLGSAAPNDGYLDAHHPQKYEPHPGFMDDQSPAYDKPPEQTHFIPTPPIMFESNSQPEVQPAAWPSP